MFDVEATFYRATTQTRTHRRRLSCHSVFLKTKDSKVFSKQPNNVQPFWWYNCWFTTIWIFLPSQQNGWAPSQVINDNLSVSRASFCCLERGGAKEALPESHQTFETAAAQTFGLVNLVFRVKLVSEGEHQCIDNDKLMVIIELVVACAWLLGLGSKLYLSNMQRMLRRVLAWFMQSLSWVHQNLANVCCCQVANYIVHFYSSRFINKTAKSSRQGQSLKSW